MKATLEEQAKKILLKEYIPTKKVLIIAGLVTVVNILITVLITLV